MNPTDALWFLGRGTGTVALALFTLTTVLGITTRSGRRPAGLDRYGVVALHQTASLTAASLVVLHVATLLFDPYAELRAVDLVLPFLGGYRSLWLGLGTAALDVLVLLVASSLLRHRIGPRAFRAVHWSSYAMWPLALVHGLGTGTDAGAAWFRLGAVGCAGTVAIAAAWRMSAGFAERGMRRVPRRTLTTHRKVTAR